MMRIQVDKLLGIESFSADVYQPYFMVEAPNAAGKTSLATAVAAAVSGQDNPLGFSAAFKKNYAHDDDMQQIGIRAVVERENDSFDWTLSNGCYHSEGAAYVNPAAVGLVNWVHMQPKDAKKLLREMLLPPEGEMYEKLESELKKVLTPKGANGIVTRVKGDGGWAATAKQYEELRSTSAAAWRVVTGEAFGSKKAEKYRPGDWAVELEGVTHEEAKKDAVDALARADELMQRKGAAAVAGEASQESLDDAEKKYQDAAAAHDLAGAELADFRKSCMPLWEKKQELQKKITSINSISETRPKPVEVKDRLKVKCPKCKLTYYLIDGELVPVKDADAKVKAEMDEWQKWHDEAIAPLADLLKESSKANENWTKLETEGNNKKRNVEMLGQAKGVALGTWDALKKKADHGAANDWSDYDEELLAQARSESDDAARRERAVGSFWSARKHYNDWLQYDAIVNILGPDGVFAGYAEEGLRGFNALLSNFCGDSGRRLEIKASGDVLYGRKGSAKRPAKLASGSERWLADAFLTMASALHTGSWITILDGADILDSDGFDVLEKAIKECMGDTTVMVCCTGWDAKEITINSL